MQAAVYLEPGKVELLERPEPQAMEDNLLVNVICCAICGTDVKLATVGHPRCVPPRVIGHEMVGRVTHVGGKVKGFAVGDRVTLATTVACGQCALCRAGRGNMCASSQSIGLRYDGAFAATLAVPPNGIALGNVVKVPEGIPHEAAALSEPLSCAINAVELAGLEPGDSVAIVGGGPLGALHAELAKALDAYKVMVVQRSEPRLSLLRNLKDVIVIDGVHEDVQARVMEETDNQGADVVIVCAPDKVAQEQSLKLACKGGAVSLFASLPANDSLIRLDSRLIHYSELRIVGASDSRPEHVRRAVELLSLGKINTEAIVTHHLPLSRFHDGIELMKNKQCLKVMIWPGKTERRA